MAPFGEYECIYILLADIVGVRHRHATYAKNWRVRFLYGAYIPKELF